MNSTSSNPELQRSDRDRRRTRVGVRARQRQRPGTRLREPARCGTDHSTDGGVADRLHGQREGCPAHVALNVECGPAFHLHFCCRAERDCPGPHVAARDVSDHTIAGNTTTGDRDRLRDRDTTRDFDRGVVRGADRCRAGRGTEGSVVRDLNDSLRHRRGTDVCVGSSENERARTCLGEVCPGASGDFSVDCQSFR